MYQLDKTYQQVGKFLLLPHFAGQERIPKPQKPDLESMAEGLYDGKPCLALFGSGSLSPQRDSMYLFFPGAPDSTQVFDVNFLYQQIRESAGITADELNIEGAVIAGETLHLFNRGRNFVASLSWPQLLKSLYQKTNIFDLDVVINPVSLPAHQGVPMGFSGASLVPDSNWMLFTATVEDTKNWYDDGEILGSYAGGLYLPENGAAEITWLAPVKDHNGVAVKDKIESIAYLHTDAQGHLHALAVTDNDDGTSKLLALRLHMDHPL
ncbi:MAG: hypothetical protein IPN33_21065 [Saprospiraceae bacterium]|nr:hypothetical protein [Saprospiraceae bacterium]